MSNPEQEAAQAVRNLLLAFKGLAAIEPMLESTGSLKQAEKEARAKLTRVRTDVARAESELATARDGVAGVVGDLADQRERCAAENAALREAARVDAETVSAAARQSAAEIVAEAKQQATTVGAELDAMRQESGRLEKTIAERQGKLAEIETKIAELRKKF